VCARLTRARPLPCSTGTVNVRAQAGQSFKQCLGYYQFWLTSKPSDVCSPSMDSFDVTVACPRSPYVAIKADVNLLWNGKTFVRDPTA
jgi:hypothetical protein